MLFPGKDSLRRSHIKALSLLGTCGVMLGATTFGSSHVFAADSSRSAAVAQSQAMCNTQGHSGYDTQLSARTVSNGQIMIFGKNAGNGLAQSYCAIFWHSKTNWNQSLFTSIAIRESASGGKYPLVSSHQGVSLNNEDPLWISDPGAGKYLFFNTKISSDESASNAKPSAGWQTVAPAD